MLKPVALTVGTVILVGAGSYAMYRNASDASTRSNATEVTAGTSKMRSGDAANTSLSNQRQLAGKRKNSPQFAQRLRAAQQERDAEIVQAKLKFTERAQQLINAVDAFESDVDRYTHEFTREYMFYSERAAAGGLNVPFPKRVDSAFHKDQISQAEDAFRLAEQQFENDLEQIQQAYRVKLQSVTTQQEGGVQEAPLPTTPSDEQIEKARELLGSLDQRMAEIVDKHQKHLESLGLDGFR